MSDIVRIKSISEVHKLLGLQNPYHPLVSVIPIDDNMTNFDYGDNTFVFDFYQVNLKEGFSGSMSYGRSSYDFEEGTLTFIKPGQTLRIENQEVIQGSSGWTLLFHPDLLRKSDLGERIQEYSFFDYNLTEALHLSDKEKASLTELVQRISDEYQERIDQHSHELIIGNIELLLKYSKRFYDRQFYTRTVINKDFVSRFERELKDYFISDKAFENGLPSASFFGKQLDMSPYYLSDLLKKETGRSIRDHIQDFVIERAKYKLLGSDESISQIAFSLGYEYPQGFNKLFKAKVGVSPSEYRRSN